jgi:hypothetical protein
MRRQRLPEASGCLSEGDFRPGIGAESIFRPLVQESPQLRKRSEGHVGGEFRDAPPVIPRAIPPQPPLQGASLNTSLRKQVKPWAPLGMPPNRPPWRPQGVNSWSHGQLVPSNGMSRRARLVAFALGILIAVGGIVVAFTVFRPHTRCECPVPPCGCPIEVTVRIIAATVAVFIGGFVASVAGLRGRGR